MARVEQRTGQPMATFWQRASGMTNGWKKRKNAKASRRFRNFLAEMEHLFYQHRRHSPAQNSAIFKGETSNAGGRMALFPSGGGGRLWTSGPRRHRWNRKYFIVLFPETLLPGKRHENRQDLGDHSLSSKSNGNLYPDGQLVHHPRCPRRLPGEGMPFDWCDKNQPYPVPRGKAHLRLRYSFIKNRFDILIVQFT